MNSGLQVLAMFAGSLTGSILLSLGQTVVVVCVCFDMVRALSVPRSHRRYVANTVFTTLAWPSILISAVIVLIDAASGTWQEVAGGVFVMVMVIFRWRHGGDEDSWWKGKGKALGRWFSKRTTFGLRPAPAAAMSSWGLSVLEEPRQVLRRERTA
jgi:predicted membrane channel-forming protein YqfA (hemolysin III family)